MMIERTPNPVEEELNAIRLRIYERIKGMTAEEESAYFRARNEPIMRQFNMKRSALTPIRPIKREERLAE